MKARVYVTFKPSVLDPQGQTIRAALNGLGHKGIEDVRQGNVHFCGEQTDLAFQGYMEGAVRSAERLAFRWPNL